MLISGQGVGKITGQRLDEIGPELEITFYPHKQGKLASELLVQAARRS